MRFINPCQHILFISDSHHKLIRWKVVTHGGMDGYSRLIVFLISSANNRSATVYSLFLEAVRHYHLPSRVCTDQGRENILVAQHIIEHHGAERRSIITGSSVHNQRIGVPVERPPSRCRLTLLSSLLLP